MNDWCWHLHFNHVTCCQCLSIKVLTHPAHFHEQPRELSSLTTTSAADSTCSVCWTATANDQLLQTAWENTAKTTDDHHRRSSVSFWLISAWCVKALRQATKCLMYFCGHVVIFVMTFLLYSFLQMLFFFLLTVTTVSLGMLNHSIFIILLGKSQKRAERV